MPRKATKADKPALQFIERPVGGTRLQHAPEVRAAVNSKEFFSETQTRNSSDLNAWVNPQFDCSTAAAPPKRRGRRKWQTVTSLLDRCSQLSRKTSACKYPSLSFHIGLKDQSEQQPPRSTSPAKRAATKVKNKARGSVCRSKRTASNEGYSDTPKRHLARARKRKAETLSEAAASNFGSLNKLGFQSEEEVTDGCRIPAEGTSTPATINLTTTDLSAVCPPPDVDTPQSMGEEADRSFSSPALFLLAQPSTPPCSGPPDSLVADTPERDYGVKVTWRRRKGLMLMLRERGHLSESDTLIRC